MAELQIAMTDQERDYLAHLLEQALKNHRVEEHRTRTPSYREHILQEENVIAALLAKLGRPAQ